MVECNDISNYIIALTQDVMKLARIVPSHADNLNLDVVRTGIKTSYEDKPCNWVGA